jgi:hypothetical protein
LDIQAVQGDVVFYHCPRNRRLLEGLEGGLKPREKEAADAGKLGADEAQGGDGKDGAEANPELGIQFAGLGVRDQAERGVTVHLGKDEGDGGDQEKKEQDHESVKSVLGLERITAEGKQREDINSNGAHDQSAHAEHNAENEIEIEKADELLGELNFE